MERTKGMTKMKFCGLRRPNEIELVNALKPDYIGFVFAPKSKRYLLPEDAAKLKKQLLPSITVVGVFVQEKPEIIAELLNQGVIEMAQLHGGEDEEYIRRLRNLTNKPILKAFQVRQEQDLIEAQKSLADFVLLDSGNGGTGTTFDWSFLREFHRPYFLAGGLNPDNVKTAIKQFHPYAVDVSSGIETDGYKDKKKMEAFVNAVSTIN